MGDVIRQGTWGPFLELLDLMDLSADTLPHAFVLLSAMCIVSYLLRTACMTAATRSVVMHLMVTTLTLLPAIVIAAVLAWAAYCHPERAWFNLLVAVALGVVWALGGAITRLARPDTEGADIGWLSHGMAIMLVVGVVAAVAFG